MKLLVVVLSLLAERFLLKARAYPRFAWFHEYCAMIKKTTDKNPLFSNPWLLLAVIVLTLVVPLCALYYITCGFVYGFFGFVLSVLFLSYSLGPKNPFYPDSKASVDVYFIAVNSELFAVLFWYMLLGPVAAFTYRVISCARQFAPVASEAAQIADILEWIPARIMLLMFLLAGNFQRGIRVYIKDFFTPPKNNAELISACGLEALASDELKDVSVTTAESLVEHALIILLVVIALSTGFTM